MTLNLGTSVSDDPLSNLLMVFDACLGKVKLTDLGVTLLAQKVELNDFIGRDVVYNQVVQAYPTESEINPLLFNLTMTITKSGQKTFLMQLCVCCPGILEKLMPEKEAWPQRPTVLAEFEKLKQG